MENYTFDDALLDEEQEIREDERKPITLEEILMILFGDININDITELKVRQLRKSIELFTQTLTDESKMMEVPDMYEWWNTNVAYKAGDIRIYGENADGETQLYKCVQAHTSQGDWTPPTTPALWKPIGIEADGYPDWTQPYGAEDAYQLGDIVHFEGELWESTCANNAWSPAVYGWKRHE